MKGIRRPEWVLFASAFVAFAWFHQGGGWNQNSRFALVRAIVEQHTFFIDDYLVYLVADADGTRFNRPPVRDGELRVEGRTLAMGWTDAAGHLVPIAGHMSPGATVIDVGRVGVSGDIAYHDGHFHPNKAPGTSLVAVPAYFVVYQLERAIGIDPDRWRVLTINAWITSALSVGLLSAIGVVLLFQLASRLSNDPEAAAVAAVLFAFGTMYFSYATMLFEHDLIAAALVGSWYLLHRASDDARARLLIGAGASAGFAAITNYIMVIPLLLLGIYALTSRRARGALLFGAGVVPPFLLICGYNLACFGTPFTTNYRYENPAFLAASGAFLGVFGRPDPAVLIKILVSPFRGIFVTAPVLLLGIAGLIVGWRSARWRRDAWLCVGVLGFFLLFNVCFNGWHGGFAVGPRYLAPALPFVTVPLVLVYRRWRPTLIALGVASVAANLVVTAVDAQPPVGNSTIAVIPGTPQWRYSPLTDYELPLLLTGQATPLLADLRRRSPTADPNSFILSTITGPVSANPVGVYEGDYFQRFKPGSPQANGNSFNVGEALAPNSIWSLVPLLAIGGALLMALARAVREPRTPPPSPRAT